MADWQYYQFQYRDGECVVVIDDVGKQHAFNVHPNGALSKPRWELHVSAGAPNVNGYFPLSLKGRSVVTMFPHSDGICRGATSHWGGKWTPLSKTTLQMAAQGCVVAPNWEGQEGPTVNSIRLKSTQRPWGGKLANNLAQSADVQPELMHYHGVPAPFNNGHPSGLPMSELTECTVCSNGGLTGLPGNACSECYNTGLVPKTTELNEMNMQEMIAVMQIQQGAKIVAAKYATNNQTGFSSQEYHFKNVLQIDLKAGDMAVVQTKGFYALVEVTDPDARANAVAVPLAELKHIIAKVDTSSIKIVTEAENNAMHALALSEVTERLGKFKEQVGESTFTTMQNLLAPPVAKKD